MNTSNNKVLITGGTSGIGLALAKKFKELNNKVVITGRSMESLEKVASLYGFEFLQVDLAIQESMDRFLIEVQERHADLNILINNAGIQYNYDFQEEPSIRQKIEQEIAVNLTAPVKLCAFLMPILLQQERSAIVNVSSGLALSPKKSAPVYCGTKAAIHSFSKALRYQLEGSPIKVFEIMPPLVDTPMTAGRGKQKVTTGQLVDEFIKGFKKDRYEIYIGKVKLLKLLHRLYPRLAYRILKHG